GCELRSVAVPRGSGVVERQAGRVDLGLGDGLVREVPGGQPLGVLAVLDQVVDGVGERLGQPAVLLRGCGGQTLERLPGAGERARAPGRLRRVRDLRGRFEARCPLRNWRWVRLAARGVRCAVTDWAGRTGRARSR